MLAALLLAAIATHSGAVSQRVIENPVGGVLDATTGYTASRNIFAQFNTTAFLELVSRDRWNRWPRVIMMIPLVCLDGKKKTVLVELSGIGGMH